ncbi:hypothetical protein XF35_38895 [Streptomyces platensis subsp. clarensis]|nr:hypothetical protein [Streptomyces platensis subsp. clarensis]
MVFRASASSSAAEPSMRVTPMYSPVASAGSISLVIFWTPLAGSTMTFISSSASCLTVSSARMIFWPLPRAASRVFSTETGCTVSPLARITSCLMASRPHHRE